MDQQYYHDVQPTALVLESHAYCQWITNETCGKGFLAKGNLKVMYHPANLGQPLPTVKLNLTYLSDRVGTPLSYSFFERLVGNARFDFTIEIRSKSAAQPAGAVHVSLDHGDRPPATKLEKAIFLVEFKLYGSEAQLIGMPLSAEEDPPAIPFDVLTPVSTPEFDTNSVDFGDNYGGDTTRWASSRADSPMSCISTPTASTFIF